ncbi:GNAT family N-acetyltransferase [Streptomyces sp. NBC_01387]|uniref:GNAT family N-acetyltransferase n=1 Tax=unclassified Streptomyces TaxID=2593676 RepID=UPI00202557E2|nr:MULTISPECIES: GNAT family N-acetyltransferase [unclassified Streptomyces]MCX4548054.1 GNAT family N-acetyltransferase [Streptomyces sp. NBC_01500]WSC19720.1 GNAT family N-acetyltransferase [Streptomyces sp. NBC_01766]WSV53742.1 GNAT family N-acetyltransferase [Streptomyces sp. NBC_01014]
MRTDSAAPARGTLAEILAAAARGVFPPPDGSTTVVAQPNTRDAGVLAFTAHSVVFLDEDPEWIRATLAATDCDPLAATMNPGFLAALMARTGRRMNTIDLLTAAPALPGPPPLALREIEDPDHPRVVRARTFRDGVRVWAADGGVLILGQGVAGRPEAAVEVDEAARGRGLGPLLAVAARHLVDGGTVWAQQSPGNARSVRAFRTAGYRPVGSEALLVADRAR